MTDKDSKSCHHCGELKLLEAFPLTYGKNGQRYYRNRCKACSRQSKYKCKECKESKPIDAFEVHHTCDGPMPNTRICKACKVKTVRKCNVCEKTKAIEEFQLVTQSNGANVRRRICKRCVQDRQNAWIEDNRDHVNEQALNNLRRRLSGMDEGELKIYRELQAASARANTARVRRLVFDAYGGRCSCCGESEESFLSIDHIDNSGYRMRKSGSQGSGAALHQWLVRHEFPEGYQVLCMNCNFGKSRNRGQCPHVGRIATDDAISKGLAGEDLRRAKAARYARKRRRRIKEEVLLAYGGARCACCGETMRESLSIDHMFNDGARMRREGVYGTSSAQFYAYLRREGFPEGYQVLCMNCQHSKHRNDGVCAHVL